MVAQPAWHKGEEKDETLACPVLFSQKELSCTFFLSGRFCSKLRKDHLNAAKTIPQEPQQPEKPHPCAALDRCRTMEEYCPFLKRHAGRDAKYPPCLRRCETAAGTQRSPVTVHMAGVTQDKHSERTNL